LSDLLGGSPELLRGDDNVPLSGIWGRVFHPQGVNAGLLALTLHDCQQAFSEG
jgi:hypothetical protein